MEIETSSPSRRQTLTYLSNLFQQHGLRPKNKLGQNFLIDLNLLDVLVQTAELAPADLVVEIGTGTGSLTARLAEKAGAVFSVEIDPAFHALARQALGDRPNVRLVLADILKNKNQLQPEVLTQLENFRKDFRTVKLVANLPFAVATPVITNFLLLDWSFERLVVTVQWEIAERLLARPGRKIYGALAVLVQSLADVRLIRRLPPAVFWPRPKVASAMVLLEPNADRRARAPAAARLRHFLRDLYAHRRKNLRGALAACPSGRRDKNAVDRRLAELGIDGQLRAETLTVEDHWRLCQVFG